jgi:hypothetical protein
VGTFGFCKSSETNVEMRNVSDNILKLRLHLIVIMGKLTFVENNHWLTNIGVNSLKLEDYAYEWRYVAGISY